MSLLAEGLRAHFSIADLERLASAVVGIAGAGGLGSNVAMLLVRSGVRRLLLVDGDYVAPSNLNRQFFWPEDVGKAKVAALSGRLRGLEPDLVIEARHEWLDPAAVAQVFAGCDVVVEALDDAKLKAACCSALLAHGFTVIAASGVGGYGKAPMRSRRLGARLICVGDFCSAVGEAEPALAPRVMQAAGLQADAVLGCLLAGNGQGDPLL
jgi:sulfur carrier protein ThiS adenylyltransferase